MILIVVPVIFAKTTNVLSNLILVTPLHVAPTLSALSCHLATLSAVVCRPMCLSLILSLAVAENARLTVIATEIIFAKIINVCLDQILVSQPPVDPTQNAMSTSRVTLYVPACQGSSLNLIQSQVVPKLRPEPHLLIHASPVLAVPTPNVM